MGLEGGIPAQQILTDLVVLGVKRLPPLPHTRYKGLLSR